MDKNLIFIYFQVVQSLVETSDVFDAFFSALTAYFQLKGQCEKRPSGLPRDESGISVPITKAKW